MGAMTVVVLVIFCAALWILGLTGGRWPEGATTPEQTLLRLCLGDRSKMQRLISYEYSRAPGIDAEEAMRRAVERLAWGPALSADSDTR